MALAYEGVLVRMHFTVFDTDGTTPLTGQAGSITDSLLRNGAAAPESVTVVEIGSTGHYVASFTPATSGDYDLEVTNPDGRVLGERWVVEASNSVDTGFNIPATLKRLLAVRDGDTNVAGDVMEFEDKDGGVETTHTVSDDGTRVVS